MRIINNVIVLCLVFSSASVMCGDFGNKTKNLIKTRDAIAAYLADGSQPPLHEAAGPYKLNVPAFFGVSHQEVVDFLRNKNVVFGEQHKGAFEHLMTAWSEFKKQFAKQSELSDEAKKSLKDIQSIIEAAFEPGFTMAAPRDEELTKFLSAAHEQNQRLMVRSTGKEDTKELANAGGNESIPAVSPQRTSVTKAMMAVILSYFSEKSFAQRIASDDQGIFDDPFMPVLLQIMIEEPENAQSIPVSGVMFSREPYGNTQDVMAVNATYGHGETVVNSIFPTDTFFLSGNHNPIHAVIRIKHSRKVPSRDKAELDSVPNPLNLQKKSSLNEGRLRRLYHFSKYLEAVYGHGVDVEFVTEGTIIHIVQVRPIVESKNLPSYVDPGVIEKLSSNRSIRLATIVAGGSAVQIIEKPNQVIVTEDIKLALDEYLFHRTQKQRNAIKLIIVGQSAPITSHEATLFRAKNKTVVVAADLSRARAFVNGKEGVTLSDIQQGLLLNLDKKESNLNNIIRSGWLFHPIPQLVSVAGDFLPKKPGIIPRFSRDLASTSIAQIFHTIVTEMDASKASEAIRHLCFLLKERVDKEEIRQKALVGKTTNEALNIQLRALLRHFLAAADEMEQAVIRYDRSKKTEADLLQRMYPLVFMRALISQVPMDEEVFLPFSIGYLLSNEKLETSLRAGLGESVGPNRAYVVQLRKLGRYALTEDVWKNFELFLRSFEEVEQKNDFISMVFELTKSNVIQAWLNLSFKEFTNAKAKAYELLEIFAKDRPIIERANLMIKEAKSFPISEFEQPAKFMGLEQQFNEKVLAWSLDSSFYDTYQQSSVIGKLVGINAIGVVVSQFDLALKTLSRSQAYKEISSKAGNFESFLKLYLGLLSALIQNLVAEAERASLMIGKEHSMSRHLRVTIPSLIKESSARAFFNEYEANVELLPSARFNVAGGKFGSNADWSRSIGLDASNKPTLEDIFTLIHQNLLVILGQLSRSSGIMDIPLPPLLTTVVEIASQGDQNLQPELLGISFENDHLVFSFNQSLRNHSASFQLKYGFSTGKTSLAIQFMGQARDRWGLFANIAQVFSKLNLGALSLLLPPKLDVSRGLVDIEWVLLDEASAKVSIETFFIMARQTIAPSSFASMINSVRDAAKAHGIDFSENLIASTAARLINTNPRMLDIFLLYAKAHPGNIDPDMKQVFDNFPSLKGLDFYALKEVFSSIRDEILNKFSKDDYQKFIANTPFARELRSAVKRMDKDMSRLNALDRTSIEFRSNNGNFKNLWLNDFLSAMLVKDDEFSRWAKERFKIGFGEPSVEFADTDSNIKWFKSVGDYAYFIIRLLKNLVEIDGMDDELRDAFKKEIRTFWSTYFDQNWMFVFQIIRPMVEDIRLKPILMSLLAKRDLVKDILAGLEKKHDLMPIASLLSEILGHERMAQVIEQAMMSKIVEEDHHALGLVALLWAKNSVHIKHPQRLVAQLTHSISTNFLSNYLFNVDRSPSTRPVTDNDMYFIGIAVKRHLQARKGQGESPRWTIDELHKDVLIGVIDKFISRSTGEESRLAILVKLKELLSTANALK